MIFKTNIKLIAIFQNKKIAQLHLRSSPSLHANRPILLLSPHISYTHHYRVHNASGGQRNIAAKLVERHNLSAVLGTVSRREKCYEKGMFLIPSRCKGG
ncbi:hypothetical protein CEXT_119641 [Caerostris extrusa]|uniref:Uncharacterized protein n=1 Tax=Caerostris extrusa TaxID=172846 RepID=A0AAV4MM04_CAEEX|nr:hypothetical protein CEXT_119641 [Caerostris extrusa]